MNPKIILDYMLTQHLTYACFPPVPVCWHSSVLSCEDLGSPMATGSGACANGSMSCVWCLTCVSRACMCKDGDLGACCSHITDLRDNNDALISAALPRLTAGHEA